MSNLAGGRRGILLVVVLVVGVTALAGVPWLIASEDAQRPPPDPQLTMLELPDGVTLDSLESGEVVEILDGDTIDVRLEDGMVRRVRYFGIDSPERGAGCYRESTDRNEQLIGDTVLLLPDEREQDTAGRLLRYVFREDGTSVDATLVAEGFAEAWRADGRYRDQIIALEEDAQEAGRGCLW